jgi:hypothetical protein
MPLAGMDYDGSHPSGTPGDAIFFVRHPSCLLGEKVIFLDSALSVVLALK